MNDQITIDRGFFDEQLLMAKKAECERIIKLIQEFQPELITKGATDRDIEAFDYAIWQFRYKLVDAIKGESE